MAEKSQFIYKMYLTKYFLGTIYKLTKECTTDLSFRKLEQ